MHVNLNLQLGDLVDWVTAIGTMAAVLVALYLPIADRKDKESGDRALVAAMACKIRDELDVFLNVPEHPPEDYESRLQQALKSLKSDVMRSFVQLHYVIQTRNSLKTMEALAVWEIWQDFEAARDEINKAFTHGATAIGFVSTGREMCRRLRDGADRVACMCGK